MATVHQTRELLRPRFQPLLKAMSDVVRHQRAVAELPKVVDSGYNEAYRDTIYWWSFGPLEVGSTLSNYGSGFHLKWVKLGGIEFPVPHVDEELLDQLITQATVYLENLAHGYQMAAQQAQTDRAAHERYEKLQTGRRINESISDWLAGMEAHDD